MAISRAAPWQFEFLAIEDRVPGLGDEDSLVIKQRLHMGKEMLREVWMVSEGETWDLVSRQTHSV